jgi:mycothiol synthase
MDPRLTLRPATSADAPAIVDIVNAHAQEVVGTRRALLDETGRLRLARSAPWKAEQWVATTKDGSVVAFVYLGAEQHPVVYETGGAVHPRYRGQGIGTRLLAWAEHRTLEHVAEAMPDAKVVLQCNIFEDDHLTRALLIDRNYALAREWIHLKIELATAPPAPRLPDQIVIRQMDQRRDWPQVDAALAEAFEDHWGQLQSPVESAMADQDDDTGEPDAADEDNEDDVDDPYFNSAAFCFVALHGAEVVGSCLGNARTVEWPDQGRVGSLSVRRQYRGRGIGRALMLHAFQAFYDHGIRQVSTDTDADNFTGSYRLYLDLGMRIFRREHLYEKEIRPGRELRLLSPDGLAGGLATG